MHKVFAATLLLVLGSVACPSDAADLWRVPAEGGSLTAESLLALQGKTCWGAFDKGNNVETARGALFFRFERTAPIADFWRKWGKEAQLGARRDTPEGYEYRGKTTIAQLTPAGTEITFSQRGVSSAFDWFIRPIGGGSYKLRAVGNPDSSRGTVGELYCA